MVFPNIITDRKITGYERLFASNLADTIALECNRRTRLRLCVYQGVNRENDELPSCECYDRVNTSHAVTVC